MNTAKLKVREVGNSFGVTLSRDVIERLGVTKGDQLHLVEFGDGYMITAFDPTFDAKLDAFDDVQRKYRNTLRKLAQ